VRDALDLSVDRGRSVPPRLLEDAPERSGLRDADSRHRAALEWPSWWQDAVGWRVGKENSHFNRAAPFFRVGPTGLVPSGVLGVLPLPAGPDRPCR